MNEQELNNRLDALRYSYFKHVNCRCIISLHFRISLYEKLTIDINYFIYN